MDRIQVNADLRGFRSISENPVTIAIILPYGCYKHIGDVHVTLLAQIIFDKISAFASLKFQTLVFGIGWMCPRWGRGTEGTGPEVIKPFLCSTQLSMKFFLLINVKMPTIVGILTFMNRKNSYLGWSEPEKCWISWYFHTYEQLKFYAQFSFITSGPGLGHGGIACVLQKHFSSFDVVLT